MRSLSNPWLVGAVSVLIHAVGVLCYVHRMEAEPDILMAVGADRFQFPVFQTIKSPLGNGGYDGQFYYAIAHAPFAKYGPEVDFPAGRQHRILLPLLGYVASVGHPEWLPVAMPVVNVLLVGLLTVMGAAWARRHGLNPWYGLTLPFAVNAALPTFRNLTDATAMTAAFALMLAALTAARPWWVGLAALAAVLAREQNAAIAAVVLGHSLWQRRWGSAIAVGLAFAVYGGWVWWLTTLYDHHPFLPGQGNFGPPFYGLKVAGDVAWTMWGQYPPDAQWSIVMSCALFLAGVAAVAVAIGKMSEEWKRPALAGALAAMVALLCYTSNLFGMFEYAAMAYFIGMLILCGLTAVRLRREEWLPMGMATAGAMLVIVGGEFIYADYWSYGRAMFWLPMGLWLIAVQRRNRPALRWAAVTLYFPVCTALYR